MKAIDHKVKGYRKTFRKYGTDPRALQWKNKESQSLRFKELLRDLELQQKSILDFGCGLGDIVSAISAISTKYEYIGTDVVPEFIRAAKEAYKTRNGLCKNIRLKFLVRDILKNPLRRKFDVVLTSGTLNANIKDALRYRRKVIGLLWQHAEYAFAFNMAGGFPQPPNKKSNRVFYANSLEILKYCLSLTSKVIFRQSYRKNDFTIIMFR